MKVIAHTTGNFQLLDGLSGDLLSAHRPSVVTRTPFIRERVGLEQVKVIAEAPDAATDAEFAKHWKEADGDIELAVQSFLSTFEEGAAEEGAAEEGTAAPRASRKRAAQASE